MAKRRPCVGRDCWSAEDAEDSPIPTTVDIAANSSCSTCVSTLLRNLRITQTPDDDYLVAARSLG